MNITRLSAALLTSLLIISCKNTEPPPLTGQEDVEKDRALAVEFRTKYARWIVSTVPEFDRVEHSRIEKRMILKKTGKLQLELHLGDRWSLARQYNPSRTESRYRLTDAKGRVLASAESMLAV